MLKIYADFNDETVNGEYWILYLYDEKLKDKLEDKMKELNISEGDKVILTQDNDFEVIATLQYRYVDVIRRIALVAIPDWSTYKINDTPA